MRNFVTKATLQGDCVKQGKKPHNTPTLHELTQASELKNMIFSVKQLVDCPKQSPLKINIVPIHLFPLFSWWFREIVVILHHI